MEGSTGTITVTCANGCSWTTGSNESWIHVTSGGSGSGIVTYTIDANPGDVRTSKFTIAGQEIQVYQAAHCQVLCPQQRQACIISHQTEIEACQPNCQQSIIQQYPGCAGNPGPCMELFQNCTTQCVGQIQQNCNTQESECNASCNQVCANNLTPMSANAPVGASTGAVSVNSVACNWTTSNNNSAWITINSGASGTGNGGVSYSLAANSGPQRSGTLTIAGKTFTVNQCGYSISPTARTNVASSGGTGSVSVTCGSACPRTASSNASWISVTGGNNGNGNGTINYSVTANSGSARNGTITIGNQTFSVSQLSGCSDQCNLQAQSCPAQMQQSCASSCTQSIIAQNPGCASNPGACMELFQACSVQCIQQSCNSQLQQCLAGCN
jgi:hypothetical protein